jgi:hypothetical protein
LQIVDEKNTPGGSIKHFDPPPPPAPIVTRRISIYNLFFAKKICDVFIFMKLFFLAFV